MSSEYEVLVVGAGPAGIAAACAAAECGVQAGLVDDNPAVGGQIWRNEANSAIDRLQRSGVALMTSTAIFDAPETGILRAERGGHAIELRYRNLVLATGAREMWIPFPGWTLPNVLGAGGLQALVKAGLPIAGRRVVVAGSGPLLLAVAAYLEKNGAHIALVAEQASKRSLAWFGMSLLAHASKVPQALQLQWQLRSVEYATSCWPVEARLGSMVLQRNGRLQTVECDYLACSFGLVPNTELPEMLGCVTANGSVVVDETGETSVSGVFCAGEMTGVGGWELAEAEGAIAGYAAAGQPRRASARSGWFADALARAFALRPELRSLPDAETLICRCEDVPWSRLRDQDGWREAKLQTRCGMGPCQGRVCGPSLQFLKGWAPSSVRTPLSPVPVQHLVSRERA